MINMRERPCSLWKAAQNVLLQSVTKRKTNTQLCGHLWRNFFHQWPPFHPLPSGLYFDNHPTAAPVLATIRNFVTHPSTSSWSVACCHGNSRQWNGLSLGGKTHPLLSLPFIYHTLCCPEPAGYQTPLTDRSCMQLVTNGLFRTR